ncbi:cbb3-type cytochrome oxidase subunit 3 [Sulfuricystis multivorans]|uniref:cbb3-type cytochrome oxidase subunit 3 n=1 Tax=Sulfuricystis multivorans TaxID=2211108 RepID=UPI000F82ECEE|nr:cbb3-type cytochrome c oxidase subunit 3 [Sulfuricystis multivorans]
MDINDLRSLFTVLVIVLFAGIVWWAYSAKQKAPFDEAARSVLDDDLPAADKGAGQTHN